MAPDGAFRRHTADGIAVLPQNVDLEKQKQSLSGRIPFVIGVTGHRDLREEDEPALRRETATAIRRLKHDYLGDDPNTPIVILSALAEGADSLVAEVALEHGAILIAPLPMEEAEYREDFKPDGALRAGANDKLTELLGCSVARIEMPYRDSSSRETVRSDPDKRADQYQDAGLYIVNNCHVLVALWNGEKGLKGGSSEMVDFKLNGIPYHLSKSARIALDGSEIGPIIEIVTPRKKAGSAKVEIETKPWGFALTGAPALGLRRAWRWLRGVALVFFGRHPDNEANDPQIRGWNIFQATTQQTRRFNREAAEREASVEGREKFEKSLTGLCTDYADAGAEARRVHRGTILPPKRVTPVHFIGTQAKAVAIAGRWCSIYQRADSLALKWQEDFKGDWKKLFTAGFIAIAFFEAYAHLWNLPALLILYIAALFYGFFLFSRARANFHQERFLDYRALAEALRVAIYWKLARIDDPVSDAYPIKQPSELAWVKIALRTLDMLEDGLGTPADAADRQALDDVRHLWIVGQWAYFTAKSKQLNLLAEKREEWSLAALALSPLIGAIGLGTAFFFIDPHHWEHSRHYMIVAMGLLAGLGAVLAGYTEQLAIKAQGRQYERMSLVFEHALLLVNKTLHMHPSVLTPAAVEELQRLYVELGKEAMKENADWVAIYRQRPIRPAG